MALNRKTTRMFSVFWLLSGGIWLLAAVRNEIVNDDPAGTVIYGLAAFFSFILTVAYRKDLVK